MSDTFETLKKIMVDHVGVEPETVTLGASLIDDLGMDSLDKIEVLMAVEEEFGHVIDDDEAERVCTMLDAVKLIDKTRAAA